MNTVRSRSGAGERKWRFCQSAPPTDEGIPTKWWSPPRPRRTVSTMRSGKTSTPAPAARAPSEELDSPDPGMDHEPPEPPVAHEDVRAPPRTKWGIPSSRAARRAWTSSSGCGLPRRSPPVPRCGRWSAGPGGGSGDAHPLETLRQEGVEGVGGGGERGDDPGGGGRAGPAMDAGREVRGEVREVRSGGTSGAGRRYPISLPGGHPVASLGNPTRSRGAAP
jgi:hypothetical protein